jgi:nucleoid-associated protein YgaU
MKSALLTIFGVAIASSVAAGPLYASEAAAPDSGTATTADVQDAVDSGTATTADGEDAVESATLETASTGDASATESVASDAGSASENLPTAPEQSEVVVDEPVPASLDAESVTHTPADSAVDDPIEAAQAVADDIPIEVAPAAETQPTAPIALGEIGYDEHGRAGRIHIVVSGDTLWDISDAYLGTPWVWPSVWTDNRDIENPHLIVPDDRIWITASEMRRVSAEEAERLLAGQPLGEDQPASAADTNSDFEAPIDDPADIVRISSAETTGFLTADQIDSAASVVDAVPERVMLSQGDRVYIGIGGSEVSVGDQFSVFRTREKVFDPDTNRLLGYHVDMLGWVEVIEPKAETSLASIRLSASEIEIGDRIVRRELPVLDVAVGSSPQGVDGKISFFPSSRVLMGSIDYVYLNRGELDGLEVGSPLEVYRTGWIASEPARKTKVEVPDRVIAQLLVVRAQPETAVAMITHTETELELGDRFRGTTE